ncbi:MAG: EamA family transporter [Actinomycetales bacterium]
MWIAWAAGAAGSAGVVAILVKAGLAHTPSNLATALRTLVVVLGLWTVVLADGRWQQIPEITSSSLLFLVLSGLATGASWLAYLRALARGPVNPVVAIDNSSIALTVLIAMLVFGETALWGVKLVGITAIVGGTMLMVRWIPTQLQERSYASWLPFAMIAALFASLTAILGKIGIADVDVTLGTAIRTLVVLVMAWVVVFLTGQQRQIRGLRRRDIAFIALSGVATGASWLCFYQALQSGPVTAVVPIDRLSVVVTAVLAFLIFRERLTRRGMIGLGLIVLGTLAMIP